MCLLLNDVQVHTLPLLTLMIGSHLGLLAVALIRLPIIAVARQATLREALSNTNTVVAKLASGRHMLLLARRLQDDRLCGGGIQVDLVLRGPHDTSMGGGSIRRRGLVERGLGLTQVRAGAGVRKSLTGTGQRRILIGASRHSPAHVTTALATAPIITVPVLFALPGGELVPDILCSHHDLI